MNLFSKVILIFLCCSTRAQTSAPAPKCDAPMMPKVESMKPKFGGSDAFYDLAKDMSDGLQDSEAKVNTYENLGALVFGNDGKSPVKSDEILKDMLFSQTNAVIFWSIGLVLIAAAIVIMITTCFCQCCGGCTPKEYETRTSYMGYVHASLLIICCIFLLTGTLLFNNAESDMIESVDNAVVHTTQISLDLTSVMGKGTKELTCEVNASTEEVFEEVEKMVKNYADTVIKKTSDKIGLTAVQEFDEANYKTKTDETEAAQRDLELAVPLTSTCQIQAKLIPITGISTALQTLSSSAKKMKTNNQDFKTMDGKLVKIQNDIAAEVTKAQGEIDKAKKGIREMVKSINAMLEKIQVEVEKLTKSMKVAHKDLMASSEYSAGQIVLRIFVSLLALLGAAIAVFAAVAVVLSMWRQDGVALKLSKFVFIGFYLTIIFAIIILAFTSAVFIVGWLVSSFCVPIFDDPEFHLFQLRKEPLGNGSNNSSNEVNMGDVLKACQNPSMTIYGAIGGKRIFSAESINKQLNLDGIRDSAKDKINQQQNDTFKVEDQDKTSWNTLESSRSLVDGADETQCSTVQKQKYKEYLTKLDESYSLSKKFYESLDRLRKQSQFAVIDARKINHDYFIKPNKSISDSVEKLMKNLNGDVFKCSGLIQIYRNGEHLMCERFGKPIHALWASIGLCGVVLFVLSLDLLLAYKWLKSKDGKKPRKSKNSRSASKKSKESDKKKEKKKGGKSKDPLEDEDEKEKEGEEDEALEKGKKKKEKVKDQEEEEDPLVASPAPPPMQKEPKEDAFPPAATAPAPAEPPADQNGPAPPAAPPAASPADPFAAPPPADPFAAPPVAPPPAAPPVAPPPAPADPFAPPPAAPAV